MNTTTNTRLALSLLVLASNVLSAHIEKISFKVRKFSCDHCAQEFAQTLAQQDGIDTVNIREDGKVTIDVAKNKNVHLGKLNKLVTKHVNTPPKDLNLIATGKITREEDTFYFSPDDTQKIVVLSVPQCIKHGDITSEKRAQAHSTKKSNAFVRGTKKVWHAATGWISNVGASKSKFEKKVLAHHKHNAHVRLASNIHRGHDGKLAIANHKATIKEL